MKKGLVIGCGVVAALIIIVGGFCAGFTYMKSQEYIGNNTKVAEELMGDKVPDGYLAIVSFENEKVDPPYKMVFLKGPGSCLSILIQFPPASNEEEKERILKAFTDDLSKQREGESYDVKPAGQVEINGKEADKFDVDIDKEAGGSAKGILMFFAGENSSLLAMYFDDSTVYDESKAMEFFKAIKR